MANADRPRGFMPKGWNIRANKYTVAEAVYPGDAVNMDAAGKVQPADASEEILGVCIGYASANLKEVLVCDDPSQLYIVQSDSADVAALSDFNLNYNITATAGNSTFKSSRMELDGNTGATTATLPLKLLEIDRRPDNAFGSSVDCIVKINNHQLAGGTGTVGV